MKANQLAHELEFRTGIKKIFFFMLGALSVAFLLLAFKLFTTNTLVRQTLVPPEIKKTFWVDDERISSDYLEQMGKFILDLAVNNTPLNCETNRIALLKYTSSKNYGAVSSQTAANCAILAKTRMSLFFSVSEVKPRESDLSIIFVGSFTRWLNDKRMPDRQTALKLKFNYVGGRINFEDIVEVDSRVPDPFSEKAEKKDVVQQMDADMATSLSPNETIVKPQADEPLKTPTQN